MKKKKLYKRRERRAFEKGPLKKKKEEEEALKACWRQLISAWLGDWWALFAGLKNHKVALLRNVSATAAILVCFPSVSCFLFLLPFAVCVVPTLVTQCHCAKSPDVVSLVYSAVNVRWLAGFARRWNEIWTVALRLWSSYEPFREAVHCFFCFFFPSVIFGFSEIYWLYLPAMEPVSTSTPRPLPLLLPPDFAARRHSH